MEIDALYIRDIFYQVLDTFSLIHLVYGLSIYSSHTSYISMLRSNLNKKEFSRNLPPIGKWTRENHLVIVCTPPFLIFCIFFNYIYIASFNRASSINVNVNEEEKQKKAIAFLITKYKVFNLLNSFYFIIFFI